MSSRGKCEQKTFSIPITWSQAIVHPTHIDAKLETFLNNPCSLDTMMPSQTSESLVKRLAGPSTGKAGLAKDQTEINRIIAEASKGSRFYEVGLGDMCQPTRDT